MEEGLAVKGLGKSTRKVLEECRGLKSMDVILPTTEGNELKLKIVSQPDPALKILLQHLNLKCPKQLKNPPNVVEKINASLNKNQPLNPFLTA